MLDAALCVVWRLLLQEATPSIECGSHSQVFFRYITKTFQTVPLGLNTLQWHGEDEEEDSQVI